MVLGVCRFCGKHLFLSTNDPAANFSAMQRLCLPGTRQAREGMFLASTAQVPEQSAPLSQRVIENERPDAVSLELAGKRFQRLVGKTSWRNPGACEIIRRR